MTTLADLKLGERGRVIAVPSENRQRLLEMGLTKGATVFVARFAPLGDPMDVKLRGYHLSLRRHEAAGVEVERV